MQKTRHQCLAIETVYFLCENPKEIRIGNLYDACDILENTKS